MSKKRYYLAYGSNLNKAQMQKRCPGAKPIGKGLLEGYELFFKGSKTGYYLTISGLLLQEGAADSGVPHQKRQNGSDHRLCVHHE